MFNIELDGEGEEEPRKRGDTILHFFLYTIEWSIYQQQNEKRKRRNDLVNRPTDFFSKDWCNAPHNLRCQ